MLAGPFAAGLMAEFGAEVIKVEHPRKGDPLRQQQPGEGGESFTWIVEGRNKASVTLDLSQSAGQDLLRALAAKSDVLIESFRPGTLEGWGLAPESLLEKNPDLVILRVSGFGQSGPLRSNAGYNFIAQGFGGLAFLTGYPDSEPILGASNVPLADYLSGAFGAIGILVSLMAQQLGRARGQVIDLALYDAIFRFVGRLVPQVERLGETPVRAGNDTLSASPSGTFPTQDHSWVVISVVTDSHFEKLALHIGHAEWLEDGRFQTREGRVQYRTELNLIMASWAGIHSQEEILSGLRRVGVAAGPVHSLADILKDPQYAERGNISHWEHPGVGIVGGPASVPFLSQTPGTIRSPAPVLGADTSRVLSDLLGLSGGEITKLRKSGVI